MHIYFFLFAMLENSSVIHNVYRYARNNMNAKFPFHKLHVCMNIDFPIFAFGDSDGQINFDFTEGVYNRPEKFIIDTKKTNYNQDWTFLNEYIKDTLRTNYNYISQVDFDNRRQLTITVPMHFYRYEKGKFFFCEISDRVRSCIEYKNADVS